MLLENDDNSVGTMSRIDEDQVFKFTCCITVLCCVLSVLFIGYVILM